jgi:hypothetical protein
MIYILYLSNFIGDAIIKILHKISQHKDFRTLISNDKSLAIVCETI